jgi:homoserine acetyltransferase
MLLYKALKLGYIGRKEYEEKTKNIKSYEGSGFQTAHKKCINEKGEKFIQLVDSNLENGNISFTDALDYLRVKAEQYEKIIQSIKG